MENKPLFKKTDILIIGAVLLLALMCMIPRFFGGKGDPVAVITADNEIVAEIGLKNAAEQTIEVNGTKITVKNGEISFTDSDCDDKICIKTGALNSPGDSSACVPNRVSIYVKGEVGDFDVVAY